MSPTPHRAKAACLADLAAGGSRAAVAAKHGVSRDLVADWDQRRLRVVRGRMETPAEAGERWAAATRDATTRKIALALEMRRRREAGATPDEIRLAMGLAPATYERIARALRRAEAAIAGGKP